MTLSPYRHLFALVLAAILLLGACGGDDDSSSSTTSTSSDSDGSTSSTTTTADSGDDEASPARDAYVDALEAELRSSESDLPTDDDSPACIAGALVDAAGIDFLESEGITVEDFAGADTLSDLGVDLDASAIDRLGAQIDGCVDLLKLLVDTAPPGYACLVDTIDSSVLSRAFAEDLAVGSEFDPSAVMFESATPACAEEVFLSTGVARGDIDEEQAACVADNLDDEVPLRILLASSEGRAPGEAEARALEAAFAACGVNPAG